jgi:hypothetical protein
VSSGLIFFDILINSSFVAPPFQFPNEKKTKWDPISYTILASAIAKAAADPKKASAGILEKIQLDTELYRLGHNKACVYIYTYIQSKTICPPQLLFFVKKSSVCGVFLFHLSLLRLKSQPFLFSLTLFLALLYSSLSLSVCVCALCVCGRH